MALVEGVPGSRGRSTASDVEERIKGEQIGLSDGVVGPEADITPVASPKVRRKKSPEVSMCVLRELSKG